MKGRRNKQKYVRERTTGNRGGNRGKREANEGVMRGQQRGNREKSEGGKRRK